jgi:transposase InsO family protein
MGFRGRGNGRGGYQGFGRVLRGCSSGATRGRGGMVSGRCHYCNNEGHWKNECLKRKVDLQRDSSGGHLASMGVPGTGKGGTNWIIDSGASRHHSARRDLFEDYINIMPTHITIGNGKEITAIGQGNISLETTTGTIELVGVLHVPEIGSNLISVASMVDQGFRVEFSKNGCMVSKWNTEKVIGKQDGNIYFLTGLQEVALAGLSHAENLATPEVWHRRIGQRSLNTQAIERMRNSVSVFEISTKAKHEAGVCAICAQGKQCREQLTGQRRKTEQILDRIYSDVCGPMAAVGLMGERYFATFIDESTGRIAITLLTQKSEVSERFIQYRMKVEKETGRKIKSLRSDGGGEYIGNQFRRYLTDNGITQQITPPYTPEHNGIAERANRTIMEIVRCLLFNSGMGKEFWGYAALTAVHIINRLPSSAHDQKTPFELWYGSRPSIGHLRIFGCKAYHHIPAATRTKLDPRAKECRLIGYAEDSGSRVYRLMMRQWGR